MPNFAPGRACDWANPRVYGEERELNFAPGRVWLNAKERESHTAAVLRRWWGVLWWEPPVGNLSVASQVWVLQLHVQWYWQSCSADI